MNAADMKFHSYWLKVVEPKVIDKKNTIVKDIEIIVNADKLDLMIEIVFVNLSTFYVPIKFPQKFTNISRFTVVNSRLKEIKKENLKQFPNLNYLRIERNDVEVIEADLFEANPLIEIIDLRDNKIWFIGENCFENLVKVREIFLNGNECIDSSKGSTDIVDFNDEVNEKCFSMSNQLKIIKKELKDEIQKVKEENESKVSKSTFAIILSIFGVVIIALIVGLSWLNLRKSKSIENELKLMQHQINFPRIQIRPQYDQDCETPNHYEQPFFE